MSTACGERGVERRRRVAGRDVVGALVADAPERSRLARRAPVGRAVVVALAARPDRRAAARARAARAARRSRRWRVCLPSAADCCIRGRHAATIASASSSETVAGRRARGRCRPRSSPPPSTGCRSRRSCAGRAARRRSAASGRPRAGGAGSGRRRTRARGCRARGPASRWSKRVRDSVISSSTGPSSCTTSRSPRRSTSHAAPRARPPLESPATSRSCAGASGSSARPRSGANRCLPCASTAVTARPASRSGQRRAPKRGCGVRELVRHVAGEHRPDAVGRVVDRVALGHRICEGTRLNSRAGPADDLRGMGRRFSLLGKFSGLSLLAMVALASGDRHRAAGADRDARAARGRAADAASSTGWPSPRNLDAQRPRARRSSREQRGCDSTGRSRGIEDARVRLLHAHLFAPDGTTVYSDVRVPDRRGRRRRRLQAGARRRARSRRSSARPATTARPSRTSLEVYVPLRLPGGGRGRRRDRVLPRLRPDGGGGPRRRARALPAAGRRASALLYLSCSRSSSARSRRLRHQAMHDTLTGLPNRNALYERVGRATGGVKAFGGLAALLLIDLDRFKEVNDTLGHDHGDRLLQRRRGPAARARCGAATRSRGSAATSSRCCSRTCPTAPPRPSSPAGCSARSSSRSSCAA